MGTWISHLRIAENLLAQLPHLDEIGFTFGNLAPDSGLPNADWSEFDPPKTVSHFLVEGSAESGTRDLLFYREYLAGIKPVDAFRYSFLLGYFVHLVSDHLAAERFGQSITVYYATLFQDNSASEAWDIVKTDGYGLDQCYVRDNRESLFWRVFLPTPIPQSPIPFIPQAAFVHQMSYIKEFYSNPDSTWKLDRPFPYLNENTMTRFVNDTTSSLLKILDRIKHGTLKDHMLSAVELLDPAEREPYPPPLGDVIECE